MPPEAIGVRLSRVHCGVPVRRQVGDHHCEPIPARRGVNERLDALDVLEEVVATNVVCSLVLEREVLSGRVAHP